MHAASREIPSFEHIISTLRLHALHVVIIVPWTLRKKCSNVFPISESEPEEMTSAPSTVDIQAIEDVETTSLMHEEPVVANGTKKIVRHYEGINPEVEAELKKVIEELEAKGGENLIVNH